MRILMMVSLFSLLTLLTNAQAQRDLPPEALADPDGAFVEVDGAQMYYIERGTEDAPVVMLLHGFGGSTFTWRHNIDPLVEAGYRVVAYDRLPYGLSDKDPQFDLSTSAQARRLAGLMDELDIERATLVGHSAGANTIAQFAVTYPDRVDALVYVAGAIAVTDDMPDFSSFFEIDALNPNSAIARQLVRTFLTPERFSNILVSAYYDPDMVTEEVREGYQRVLRVEGWEAAFVSLLTNAPQLEAFNFDDLFALDVPVAFIWGADDTWVPAAAGRDFYERHREAEWITYDEVGHLPMEEAPAQFNTDLLAFLEDVYPA